MGSSARARSESGGFPKNLLLSLPSPHAGPSPQRGAVTGPGSSRWKAWLLAGFSHCQNVPRWQHLCPRKASGWSLMTGWLLKNSRGFRNVRVWGRSRILCIASYFPLTPSSVGLPSCPDKGQPSFCRPMEEHLDTYLPQA